MVLMGTEVWVYVWQRYPWMCWWWVVVLCAEKTGAVMVAEMLVVVVVAEVAAMVGKWFAGVDQDWLEVVCPLRLVNLVCLQI